MIAPELTLGSHYYNHVFILFFVTEALKLIILKSPGRPIVTIHQLCHMHTNIRVSKPTEESHGHIPFNVSPAKMK